MSWERFDVIEGADHEWRLPGHRIVNRRISTDMITYIEGPTGSSTRFLRTRGYTGDYCIMRVDGLKAALYVVGDADRIAARLNVLQAAEHLARRPACKRCGDRVDFFFHRESGGLCGICLADDGFPLTVINPQETP